MNAEQICKMTADIIGMSYPSDKDKMFFLCRMANHEIWKQGRWHGMIKEFYVNTRLDSDGNRFITSPNGYNILLGVNLDSRPTRITNHWFQFHRNGNGSVSKGSGWNFTGSVMDMGKSPVIEQPRYRSLIESGKQDPVYLLVRSRGQEDEKANVIISGENNGQTHYSYNNAAKNNIVRSLNNTNESQIIQVEPKYGVEFKLTNKFLLCDNISWTHITSIQKTITNNPVDVYAVHDSGESYLIATLAPHQRETNYRNYMLPREQCKDFQCVHAMFKMSEPDGIEFPTQQMVTDNVTALIDMMMGMDLKYFKKDLNAASIYILSAVKALEDSTRENMSNHQTSIQVDDTIYGIPEYYLDDQY